MHLLHNTETKVSKLIVENKILKERITRIYNESEGRYGSPKISDKMKTEQILSKILNIKRIKKLMKQLGISYYPNKIQAS